MEEVFLCEIGVRSEVGKEAETEEEEEEEVEVKRGKRCPWGFVLSLDSSILDVMSVEEFRRGLVEGEGVGEWVFNKDERKDILSCSTSFCLSAIDEMCVGYLWFWITSSHVSWIGGLPGICREDCGGSNRWGVRGESVIS